MKIALISYEFAGVSGGGGIGTYVRNAVRMLLAGGHTVHLFTSGEADSREQPELGLTVTKLAGLREAFGARAGEAFAAEWMLTPVDVLEGPEFGCDAADAAARVPQVPLVVRLHGPSFTIARSNAAYVSTRSRLRFGLGALRRGHWPRNPWRFDPLTDPERAHAISADLIVANSHATANTCLNFWGLSGQRLETVRYPFMPQPSLLELKITSESRTILFLGKLEVRKGVIELARAVQQVVNAVPDARFQFVGRSIPHPDDGRPVAAHVRELVSRCSSHVEIIEAVPYHEVPGFFANAAICAFPSDWEASGFVCMEGMAAARAVVGSSAGGMSEIIEEGRTGWLVPPRSPAAIAKAIIALLGDPARRAAMGEAARERVMSAYAPHVILPLQIAAYERAIARAAARDPLQRYQ